MSAKFENVKVMNWDGALRGMRNPKASHDKSDSVFSDNGCSVIIGPNDLDLCRRLIKAGSEHRKFLRQIFVCADITFSRYTWVDFDQYKIGTVTDSYSTNHKIMSKEITYDMFNTPCIDLNEQDYQMWKHIISYLNHLRDEYNNTDSIEMKRIIFHKLKSALPEGFYQTRTWTGNYEVIYTAYKQRKNHMLREFNTDFVNFAESLPHFKELFLYE